MRNVKPEGKKGFVVSQIDIVLWPVLLDKVIFED